MIKKISSVLVVILFLISNTINVYASESVAARIGNKYFDTLEDAINAATSTDIIHLTSNIFLDKTLEINKNVNINLNNYNIEAEEQVFLIQGGSLNLSGNGKIRETKPNYGAIMLKGSDDPDKEDFSTVSVGNGITLEGWSGIFINQYNKTGYGILVNINGTINAVNDGSGSPGAGIYVNGNIQHQNNSPIINLTDTSKITSSGTGIYAAGYANYYIKGAYIEGVDSGLGIKSGYFHILDGTIIGSGEDRTPTGGNNNGIDPSGVAIQLESNPGYIGNIELIIKDGTIKSNNSNVIYEYVVNNTNTQVKDMDLSGGTYISNAGKEVFSLSDSFKATHPRFISGGSYSSDPSNYLKSGYSASKTNSLYEVTSQTISMFGLNNENSNNLSWIIIIIVLGLAALIGYINRKKIFEFINSTKK